MKYRIVILFLFLCTKTISQQSNVFSDTLPSVYRGYDTVVVTALGLQPTRNIPYSIDRLLLQRLYLHPRTQLMQQLVQYPSVDMISSGNGINKPVIRGLSFNHIQLFAQGVRMDNQSWDDRHDIGISETGFDRAEIIKGPAALLYGPNTMGGAILFKESVPAEQTRNGYVQLGLFGNTLGGNLNAGIRVGKKEWYYSLHAAAQLHANYVQGGEKKEDSTGDEEEKPLAFNSKFTNLAVKGMIGIRKPKRQHQLNYSLYQQSLGIIEDEDMEQNNPDKKEERDYEMEAPYQQVMTNVVSLENTFSINRTALVINAGYQFNNRKEFEPGAIPKSKFLGVGLDLQTVTADVQWITGKNKSAGITFGAQGFYQDNKNKGNWVLVPDAHISTIGAYVLAHWNLPDWNFLFGARVDEHKLNMSKTTAKIEDTIQPPITPPEQQLSRKYEPFSYSLGIVFHVTDQLSMKLNAANGYAAPNYAQLTAFGRHEGTFRFEIGDNQLRMERNMEGDFGFQWEEPSISASISGYYNHINNYIFITPTADTAGPLQVYRWTQHDANIYGAELNISLHPENLKWLESFLRGSLIRGKLSDSEGDLPYIPSAKLIAGITLTKTSAGKWQNGYLTLQLDAYGSQKKVAQFETSTAGYALTDVFAGVIPPVGKSGRWLLTLFCTNIFNIGYYNHLSLIKAINVNEAGRNLGAQIRYSF